MVHWCPCMHMSILVYTHAPCIAKLGVGIAATETWVGRCLCLSIHAHLLRPGSFDGVHHMLTYMHTYTHIMHECMMHVCLCYDCVFAMTVSVLRLCLLGRLRTIECQLTCLLAPIHISVYMPIHLYTQHVLYRLWPPSASSQSSKGQTCCRYARACLHACACICVRAHTWMDVWAHM